MKLWIAALLMSVLMVGQAAAATYYVDNSSDGNDVRTSSVATSKLTPWKHLPCMKTAISFAQGYLAQPGDIFVLKGGSVWNNVDFPCTWNRSGNSTSRITVTVDPTWFTGASWTRPKFDAEGAVIAGPIRPGGTWNVNAFIDMNNGNFGVSYVTFDNIEMTRFFWTGAPAFNTCAQVLTSASTNVTLDHLYIHGWLHDTYANGARDAVCHIVMGTANPPYNVGNVLQNSIVDGSDSTGGGDSSAIYLLPNVRNSIVTHLVSPLVNKGSGEIAGNDLSFASQSFDISECPPGSGNLCVHPNLLETLGAASAFTVYIHDNRIHDSLFAGVETSFLANLEAGQGNIYYWNNVLYNLAGNNMVQLDQQNTPPNFFVWNNTIHARDGRYCFKPGHTGATPATIKIQNNHCIGTLGTVDPALVATSLTITPNTFQLPAAATAQGYTNAQIPYVYAPTDSADATVGTGVNLTANCSISSQLASLCTDTSYAATRGPNNTVIAGARTPYLRPSSVAWDIGAYKLSGTLAAVSYPLVPGLSLSSTYTMTVNGVNVPVQSYGGHSFAWFTFGGTANVVVTANAPVSTYTLSPLRNATPSTKSGATVNFSLSAPKHLVLHKVNAVAEKLFIFGDAPETSPPASSGTGIFNVVTGYGADPTGAVVATTAIQNAINAATAFGTGSVVYVPAGLYTVNAAVLLKANINFYLAPGAVIKNLPGSYATNVAYHVNGQSNVKVSGRGVLYGVGTTNSSFTFLFEVGATSGTVNNFTMQDVMLLDSRSTALRIGNITNSTVTNLKILSAAPGLSDGIDADGLTNVTVDNCFILSSDDSFAVMSGQSSFSYTIPSNTDGYTVKNSLMYHTSTGHSLSIFSFHVLQYMKNILFDNNDTISTNDGFAMLASNGPIDINHVTIRNSRLEEVRRLAVEMYSVDFSVGWGGAANGFWSPDSGKINNIFFDNVIFDTAGPVFGQLVGRSATQNIDTINFNAVYMGGILATNAATAHISIGSFVSNVTYTNNVSSPDVLPPAAPTNVTVQ